MSSTAPARRSRGRPPSTTAESHALILDAVYELLQERSVRDLTIEAVAKRAKVGKPTIYKWWPTKADLVMAMFQERLDRDAATPESGVVPTTVQDALKLKVRGFVGKLNGLFGKVIAELIAEGQSDPAILEALYDRHLRERRAATVAEVERARGRRRATGRRRPRACRRRHLRSAVLPPPDAARTPHRSLCRRPGGTGIPPLNVLLVAPSGNRDSVVDIPDCLSYQ